MHAQFFFAFTTSLTWFGDLFWHQMVTAPSQLQLRGSNSGSPYQIQRQLPLNQLTID
jgi:hypothetical protein